MTAASNPAAELTEAEYHRHASGDVVPGAAERCIDPDAGAHDVLVMTPEELAARLAAGGAATDEGHRPGCREYATGWLCVSDCTTVWHDKPDAAPAPTEDAHRPGCQEYPTGWLCVSDCTTVWHDKPADTAAEEPRTEAQKACCNVREPNGEQCTGQMTKHGPEYVCDTCRARCGSLSHPQHAPSSAIEDIAYCPRCKVLVSRSHQCHLPAVAGEGLLTEAQICHETGDAIAMCCEFMPGGRHVHHPLSRADEEAGSEAQTITQRIGALMKAEREAARAELLSRDTEDQP